jgi:DNA-binding SARP family transcriptional activator/WD40 repeat protein
VDFRVLGPVVASADGGDLRLGGPKQRLILAMLLVARGESVSTDALIDGLWGDELPATARKTLQGYVHHLRTEIGDALVTDNSGYSLHLDDERVDERRFSALVDGSSELVEIDPSGASEQLSEGLRLWRGSPYADLDGEIVLRPEITRLEELRMVALGDRIDADLALGRHETLTGELESLIAESPLRERFRAQQMLALYRSGRHGEALRVFSRTRTHFVEQLGIEPSETLRALEQRILAREPSLDVEVEDRAGSPRAVRGYELRELVSADSFGTTTYRAYQRSVGREVAIRVLAADQANAAAFMARYQTDTARIAQVSHPNVVYVQDTWREPDRVYQVMRWIEGCRLDEFVDRGPPAPEVGLRLLRQLADALEVVHRHDVVHGALCAQSVVISSAGDAYLTDFVVGRDAGTVDDDNAAFACIARLLLPDLDRVHGSPWEERPAARATGSQLWTVSDVARGPPLSPADLVSAVDQALAADGDPAEVRSDVRRDLRNPYKGLRAFQIVEAGDFFGRDEVVDRLVAMLQRRRLLAVVGPSGSGKSSVVKAGLAARLDADERPVLVAEMYPAAAPFDELERALGQIAVKSLRPSDGLLADPQGLTRVLESILPDGHGGVVLVIDQFEELFSMVESEAVRSLFLDSIVAAVSAPSSPLRVVVTLRADFFDRPLRYPEFGALVEAGLLPLTMPDRSGLRAAIEGPAAAGGVAIEPGLIDEVVRDVEQQPGGLPLLQYAMTELFDRRGSDVLTLDAYRASGGVRGAVAARAEGLFTSSSPVGQVAMQQAFMRLVSIDDGGGEVRRRVRRAELDSLRVDRVELAAGLQRFGAHRLLTFDFDPVSRAPTVEVAHEALLREWGRLRAWIDEQRDQLITRRRLAAAVSEWRDADEDPGYLLSGGRLEQLDAFVGSTELALSAEERAFVESSRERSTETARRATSRRRRVTTVLLVAVVVASTVGIYALVQRNQVSHQAYAAETARLGNAAGFASEWNRQLALLMAVETARRDPGVDGLGSLQRVLVDAGSFLGVIGANREYRDVRWVSDERLVAATGTSVELVDVETGDVTDLPVDAAVNSAVSPLRAASPAGLAAVATADGALSLVDVESGEVRPISNASGSTAATISDDGSVLALGFADGRVDVVDVESGTRRASVIVNPSRSAAEVELEDGVLDDVDPDIELEGISHLAFDARGERLLSVSGVFLRVWSAEDLSPLGPEIVHAAGFDDLNQVIRAPGDVWFDANDPDVAVVVGPTFIVRWRISNGERVSITTLASRDDAVRSVAAAVGAEDGGALLLTRAGRVLLLEPAELGGGTSANRSREQAFETQQDRTSAVTIDPEGHRFAVATGGGIVLGALDGRRLLARSYPIGSSAAPSMTSDGRTLAAGLAADGLRDISAWPASTVRFDVNVEIAEVAGSPSTYRFAATSERDILIWESEFAEMANAYDYRSGAFLVDVWGSSAPSFSADGSMVASVAATGGTRIRDLRSSEVLYESPLSARSVAFDSQAERAIVTFAEPASTERERAATPAALIELPAGTEIQLPDTPGGVFAAAFTADDERLVLIGADGAARVLDAATLDVVAELQDADVATEPRAGAPVVTEDGRWMFSATDGEARVWHLESGVQVGKPFPSQAGGLPFAVSDGTLLRLVTPLDGRALIWNLDVSTWPDLACRAAGRNMSRAEWSLHGPSDTRYRATCTQYPIEEGD